MTIKRRSAQSRTNLWSFPAWREKREYITYRKEEIANIMRNIDRQSHGRKMKAIAQANQRQSNHMMRHQLLEILPRLLQHKTQHNGLL